MRAYECICLDLDQIAGMRFTNWQCFEPYGRIGAICGTIWELRQMM